MIFRQFKEAAFLIRDAFTSKGLYSLKLEDLLLILEKNSKYDRLFLTNILNEFHHNIKDFIKMESNKIVRIDRSISMQTVIDNIENWTK